MIVTLAGAFVSILMLLYLLLVPNQYGTSPGNITIDFVRRKLEEYYAGADETEKLAIINRSPEFAIKAGLIFGGVFGFLTLGLTVKLLGVFSVILALLFVVAGIAMVKWMLGNEFKKWQGELLLGVAEMVSFVPAFLKVGTLTPRESIALSIPFIPEPFRSELSTALDRVIRTADIKGAMDRLSQRARHSLVDAICFRLSVSWDARVEAGMFADLQDQITEIHEMAATRATTAKSGLFALVAVVGIIGALPVFGYPAFKFLMAKLSGGFGM